MIVCVAVVGHQNNPLYIQSFTDADDALKLHHIVHCSLDVIDERVNNPKKSGPTLNETFLGLLYPTENYKVYGYLTNTKVKFILVTTDLDVRDADVRNFFRRFHAAYVDAVSNPFHVPGKELHKPENFRIMLSFLHPRLQNAECREVKGKTIKTSVSEEISSIAAV
ncbi:hypothetical protein FNV43_RR21819 [Rhamnella rubrinervis]|uniref:Trafficking protein particle complex subunit 2-like protein n=1 Tax=Rhamnella rubrinervis TaxID=2594499 RepID=A0A8K0DVC1_9ROSA|nr:hypothetical protein FNV43_RR21819 [Rhamnella rubrinervis]